MTDEAPYDMSIHTNPDAAAWAKFYTEVRDKFYRDDPTDLFDTEENMIGWFANAMMAMHDHQQNGEKPMEDQPELNRADANELERLRHLNKVLVKEREDLRARLLAVLDDGDAPPLPTGLPLGS